MQVEMIDAAIDKSLLADLFAVWWEKWPVGHKQGKSQAWDAWLKVFLKGNPGVLQHDWKDYATNVLGAALDNQCRYRKAIFDKYPTSEDRRRADIFVPRLPMPATWLNKSRWEDAVPSLPGTLEDKVAVRMPCKDCDADAVVLVNDEGFCAWHWTKRFNREHLKLMAESLNKLGLDRKKNESQAAWSERCREYARSSKWSSVIQS